ncbi:Hypothetical protein PHPALM_36208 [Phytophthora palmivora]|uniref:Uncharacterized protein n=1 Tax=Phytophthora palmivora TaxID=4796 RepID=A0A2P4X0K0_9STRA|nr:Hypothetical protein PHPALM_36208 [Phytophthora palmivora]
MSPSQASCDNFPHLFGAENFDVWKTRVCAALDGKHLLGYVQKPNYVGISEEESDENFDSDAVDYDEESEDEKPQSDSDEDSGDNSDTSAKLT